MRKVFVRYCGGCNPGYDRVAAVTQLLETGKLLLTTENSGACLRMAVSGCSRRCAGKHARDFRDIGSQKEMEQYIAEINHE